MGVGQFGDDRRVRGHGRSRDAVPLLAVAEEFAFDGVLVRRIDIGDDRGRESNACLKVQVCSSERATAANHSRRRCVRPRGGGSLLRRLG